MSDFNFKVGDVVTFVDSEDRELLLITAIGEGSFLAKTVGSEDSLEHNCLKTADWQLYKPKTVKMALAVIRYHTSFVDLSPKMFSSQEEARKWCSDRGHLLITFPAKTDENGFYDVPVEGENE